MEIHRRTRQWRRIKIFQRREEGWKQFKKPIKTGDVAQFMEEAQDQVNEADTKEDVLEII